MISQPSAMSLCAKFLLASATLTCPHKMVVLSESVCSSIGLRCSDDCTFIELCDAIGVIPWSPVNCLTVSSNYCAQNPTSGNFECSAVQCSSPKIPHRFACTDAGTFPSPYSCGVSYVCPERGSLPTLTCTCDSGQYFDVVTGTCVPEPGCLLIPADCSTFGRIGDLGNGFCYTCHQYYTALVFRCPSNTTTNTTANIELGSSKGMNCTQYVDPPPPLKEGVSALQLEK